jgi:hypothetical protein
MSNMTKEAAKRRAEKQIVAAAMRGYRKAMRAFPWVIQKSKDPFWKACKALDKATRHS